MSNNQASFSFRNISDPLYYGFIVFLIISTALILLMIYCCIRWCFCHKKRKKSKLTADLETPSIKQNSTLAHTAHTAEAAGKDLQVLPQHLQNKLISKQIAEDSTTAKKNGEKIKKKPIDVQKSDTIKEESLKRKSVYDDIIETPENVNQHEPKLEAGNQKKSILKNSTEKSIEEDTKKEAAKSDEGEKEDRNLKRKKPEKNESSEESIAPKDMKRENDKEDKQLGSMTLESEINKPLAVEEPNKIVKIPKESLKVMKPETKETSDKGELKAEARNDYQSWFGWLFSEAQKTKEIEEKKMDISKKPIEVKLDSPPIFDDIDSDV